MSENKDNDISGRFVRAAAAIAASVLTTVISHAALRALDQPQRAVQQPEVIYVLPEREDQLVERPTSFPQAVLTPV